MLKNKKIYSEEVAVQLVLKRLSESLTQLSYRIAYNEQTDPHEVKENTKSLVDCMYELSTVIADVIDCQLEGLYTNINNCQHLKTADPELYNWLKEEVPGNYGRVILDKIGE